MVYRERAAAVPGVVLWHREAEAGALWDQLVDALFTMVGAGVVHGDLSPYNLLVADDRLVIIDFPQSVDPIAHSEGLTLLQRDVDNVAEALMPWPTWSRTPTGVCCECSAISLRSSRSSWRGPSARRRPPTRRAPWFMKALWALALLLVVGMAYSFWRISAVPTPRLDISQTQPLETTNPR